ncbi:MAG: DUF4097 family beta strand repeat protein [Lachnospiraceae bacterium]|nr:DUF4097 family beta strand repeat protein [Lachnospiraceae bacterium]
MKKITKIALAVMLAGLVLCGLSYFLTGGDWTKYNTNGNNYVAKSYESKAGIKEIVIDENSNTATIKSADTDKVTIDYYDDPENSVYKIEEDGGRLIFSRNDRSVFKLININLSKKDIVITIPRDYEGLLDIDITSGSITASGITAGEMRLDNSSGSIELDNVQVAGNISIDNTSGSVSFNNLKSDGDISIENTTGSIEGTIEGSESDYSITSDVTAGSSNLKNSTGGAHKLDVHTTAGSIEIDFTK